MPNPSQMDMLKMFIGGGKDLADFHEARNKENRDFQHKAQLEKISADARGDNAIRQDKAKREGEMGQLMQLLGASSPEEAAEQARKTGASLKLGDVAMGMDPTLKYLMAKDNMVDKEIRDIQGKAEAYMKEGKYSEKLEAARGALDQLDLGTDTGDKMAIINEASLYGGARGVATLANIMMGGKSLPGFESQLMNFMNGQGKSPLTPDMRNNLRQSIYSRVSSMQPTYNAAKQQILDYASGPAGRRLAASGMLDQFKNTLTSRIDLGFGDLNNRYKTFMDQKAQAVNAQKQTYQNPQQSYSPKEGLWDRTMRVFGVGGKQPAPAETQPQSEDPIDAEMKRRGLGQ